MDDEERKQLAMTLDVLGGIGADLARMRAAEELTRDDFFLLATHADAIRGVVVKLGPKCGAPALVTVGPLHAWRDLRCEESAVRHGPMHLNRGRAWSNVVNYPDLVEGVGPEL